MHDDRHAGSRRRTLSRAMGAAVAALLALAPSLGDAQYFGRNKVLWQRFEFEVLETEHFRIHYYPPAAPHAEYVARLSERWYARLSEFFDHEFEERKPIVIYQDHADFQQTVVTPGLIGEGTGGFTESVRDRMVLPLTGINADNDHVIGHELVHVLQFDMAARAVPEAGQPQAQGMPLWMIEGLAEYLSEGRVDPATALWMRDAVRYNALPDPDRFIQRQPSPYQYGQAAWAYIGGRWGDDAVRRVFATAMRVGRDQAFQRELGLTERELLDEFHAALRSAAAPVLESRMPPARSARALLGPATTKVNVNLAPSVSPDGRSIAFLSTYELALELFLADAETGVIERKLVQAEADPHFQSLSFLDSSVAWSPDGRWLAFGVFARGERRLAIYDVERGRIERRLDLPGIKGMRHAAWSRDGGAIVFSAIVAGASDLYRVDLETDEVERLTEDAYTAVQPVYSPDGRRIAFVTDRGPATDLERLAFGDLQLAVLDLETREIEVLEIFPRGKHVDPHFSADGASLYFIAEPDGVPDVFRYDFADGRVARLTSLETGVSGITDVSPALTLAADGTLFFSVLENGGYTVYRQPPSGGEAVGDERTFAAAWLPPAPHDAAESFVESYLARPAAGLPPAGRDHATVEYSPRISLASVGPATVGVASFDTGTSFLGALSLYFNDTLNRHQIVTTVQGGSTQGLLDFADTIGAEAVYLNQARRFQWGGQLSRVPYVASGTFFGVEDVEVDGATVPADVVTRVIQAVQVSELALIGQYPLSLNNRIEAVMGMSRTDFDRKLERLVFPDGFAPFREQHSLPSPDMLDLQEAGVAFVRDTSRFGFVSPVRGTRLRLETQWTNGDLEFRTDRIDYRRYFFRRPLTFALRALHIGRRGDGAEDPRLTPLDIGHPSLVRGYDLGSFDLSECTPVPGSNRCPEFDRLIGSRIGVLNFELRVPIFGTEDFGLFEAPATPTDGVFFIDVGAAWSAGQSVDLVFERNTPRRVPVVSAGIALRSVVLGALPIEIFYAVPFQRPQEDGMFGFRIAAGW